MRNMSASLSWSVWPASFDKVRDDDRQRSRQQAEFGKDGNTRILRPSPDPPRSGQHWRAQRHSDQQRAEAVLHKLIVWTAKATSISRVVATKLNARRLDTRNKN